MDMLYKVTDIDFSAPTLEAKETDLKVTDVPERKVFPLEDFSDFKVKLINRCGVAKVIDFEKWKGRRG